MSTRFEGPEVGPLPMAWPISQPEVRGVGELLANTRNARVHEEWQIAQVAKSIERFGWTMPILLDENDVVIAGHARAQAAMRLDIEVVPVIVARGWTEAEKMAYGIADNQLTLNAAWDKEELGLQLDELEAAGFEHAMLGFSDLDMRALFGGEEAEEKAAAAAADTAAGGAARVSLADSFGVPPFTVLNAREGWWQDRKRAWIALGIKSEIGRGDAPGSTLLPVGDLPKKAAKLMTEGELAKKRRR